ncbi:hypothetical protein H5410_059682 [Solanum commersonii]|uniref:Uncharacterized protein n=1 Tax=Solanum commersonii TaxID=4109 RepID=A0A9J5W3P8_SOLCO|nr:hypothetical protein H5410_059682 [Solanum commersonii]
MTFDKENSIVICNKCKKPFKHKQGGDQEAKALADRKEEIPVNDVDINVNESVGASNMVQGTLNPSNPSGPLTHEM